MCISKMLYVNDVKNKRVNHKINYITKKKIKKTQK